MKKPRPGGASSFPGAASLREGGFQCGEHAFGNGVLVVDPREIDAHANLAEHAEQHALPQVGAVTDVGVGVACGRGTGVGNAEYVAHHVAPKSVDRDV